MSPRHHSESSSLANKNESMAAANVTATATAGATTSSSSSCCSTPSLKDVFHRLEYTPKLIVFDLDNTLWTPELYQIRQKQVPRVNQDIRLFPDAITALAELYQIANSPNNNSTTTSPLKLAIASRTNYGDWAQQLLDDFEIQPGISLRDTFTSKDLVSSETFKDDDNKDTLHLNGAKKTKTTNATKKSNHYDTNNIHNPLIQIRGGSKCDHFQRLQDATGVSYSEMLFVDDDERLNLHEISSKLGVLCVHTPRGVTLEHMIHSIERYNQLHQEYYSKVKQQQQSEQQQQQQKEKEPLWMGYILNSQNLNMQDAPPPCGGRLRQGRVKFFSKGKRFGFVIDNESGYEYFVHHTKIPAGMTLQTGQPVEFEAYQDSANGKLSGIIRPKNNGSIGVVDGMQKRPTAPTTTETKQNYHVKTVKSTNRNGTQPTFANSIPPSLSAATTSTDYSSKNNNSTTTTTTTTNSFTTITMPCFSMSQPFASLLLNGYKTIESRSYDMLGSISPGSQLLLHCGYKDWHDQESYKQIMLQNGILRPDIEKAIQLPRRFTKGCVIGIVTIGKTWKTSEQERRDVALQRQVLAPYDGIGHYCTEIKHATWLRRPLKIKGNQGIYNVNIPDNYLP